MRLTKLDIDGARLHARTEIPNVGFVQGFVGSLVDKGQNPAEGDPAPEGGVIFYGDRLSLH